MTESPLTYQPIAEQSYDAIARDAGLRMRDSRIGELKYVKDEGNTRMYIVFQCVTFPSPPLDESTQFVAAGSHEELSDLFPREFSDEFSERKRLPSEVRVIRPRLGRDQCGVFVRR